MTWSRRMLDCAVLLGMLICASPLSAQSVQQSGVVTPTHFSCWTTGGVIQDCGVAAQPFASTGGVSPGPFCVNSGPVTGPYQSFCLNANQSTGGILSIQNFGGAAAGGISFNINGTPASLPTVVTPTVATHGACFNNTTGTLIDCGYVPIGASNAIDVILVIGDSQGVGQGSSASSPPVPAGLGFMYCANATIQALVDPSCSAVNAAQNANTGSMWPATTIAYGRRIGWVLTAVSGSTQATACDFGVGNGNWQVTTAGSNYANALAALNSAITAYTAAGYVPTFRGVIYVLGNNDAAQIDASACTVTNYTAGLTAMVANWRGATIGGTTYPHMQFWMPIIGTNINPSFPDAPGYTQVRAAQLTYAASDGNFSVPYTDLFSMAARGFIQTNSVHLNQAGLNIMGTAIGASLIPEIPANIPYQLFSQNVGIGGTAPAGTILQMTGADATAANALLDAYAGLPQVLLRRADTTLQAPSAVQNGEVIGIFGVQSYGADTFGSTNQGALLWTATQNHTDAAKGTQACIYTTANGSASPTCNLTVGQSGLISVGALTLSSTLTTNVTGSTQCLHVSSSGAVSGTGSDCSSGSGTPGGSNTQVQYNNSSAFGGISGVTSNGTSITIASGDLILAGSGSGSSTLNAPATGGGTATLFTGSDTILGAASTATLTNKTFDTAGSGNVFKINGTTISAVTGTGSAVLATSPSISGLTVTGSFTATGLVTNADLANASVTYGTTSVALGSSSTSIAGLTELSLTSASGATVDWNADTYFGRSAAAALRLGQADAAAPVAQKLGVQNVVTGTSNTAGTDWTIVASQGTGTGIGGNIKFQVAPAGLTGTSVNALADVMQIYNTKRVNVGGNFAPDAIFTINQNTGVTSIVAPASSVLHTIAADSALGQLDFDTFGAANTAFGLFVGRGSGGTRGSPTAMPAAAYIFNIQGQGYDGVSAMNGVADIGIKTLNQTSTSDASGQIIFRTNASGAIGSLTQRILILSGVTIGTGTTDPGAGQLAVTAMTQTSAAQSGTVCYSTTIGAITYDATLGCLTSLEELKDIHGPITGALEEVVALHPFWFSPIDRPAGSDVAEQPGFGAHQVETVDKRLVGYGPDGKLRGVRYMEMSALLAAAIQELKADNDNLRQEIETFKRNYR